MARLWRTTAFRLTLAFCAIFVAGIVLVLGLVYGQTVSFLSKRVDHILTSEASALQHAGPSNIVPALNAVSKIGSLSAFGLFSPTGQLVAGDRLLTPSDLPIDGVPRNVPRHGDRLPQRALAERLPWGQVLVVRRDASQLSEVRHIALGALIWSGALIVTIGLGLAVLLSARPLSRVQAIQTASEAIGAGDLTLRLPVDGSHDELDELSRIVNVMMDEVERLMGQAQTFGEAVAHELRTPLTRLRTTLDHAAKGFAPEDGRRELLERCVAETDTLLARFRALLRIAAVEARNRTSGIAESSLSAVVEQVADLYAPLAVAQQIGFRVDVEPGVRARVDGELMVEAVSNLVDNALKFTPTGGAVRLALIANDADIVIEVRDSGVGIKREERPLVTKRFYRSPDAATTPGHGLGLSLVAAVAELHGFTLTIDDANPGTVVRLSRRRV
jgi:signal transduction histidine kinase